MRFQRTIFIGCLIVCALFIIAAYSYRMLVLMPRISATAVQSTALLQSTSDQSMNNDADGSAREAEQDQERLTSTQRESIAAGSDVTQNGVSPIDNEGIVQQTIFDDQLLAKWQNWSWGSTVDLKSAMQVEAGSAAISVKYDDAWAALWLSSFEPFYRDDYDLLRFSIHGGEVGGQMTEVSLADGNQNLLDTAIEIEVAAGEWRQIDIPLADLGADVEISGISFQDALGNSQPTFFVDEISLVKLSTDTATASRSANGTTPSVGSGTQIAIEIDVSAERRPINPDIYGINFGNDALVAELGHTVRRWGGNATTRYNWQFDIANRASDWFFENIASENENLSALPRGSSADQFVATNQATGAKTIMTMPLIGWTPKNREFACSYPVSRYGAQQQTDQWRPDCGNGYTPGGEPIAAEPSTTSVAIDPTFVSNWIAHLVREFGSATQGGVAYYNLDNEPMLWHHTHRDVHPEPVGYDELYERTVSYASAIKRADPSALTLGPALWGWTAYEHSAKDIEEGGGLFNRHPDRAAHDDMPLVAWYLQQMADYERQNGVRILDYLDLHYYPQANGIALAPAGSPQTRQKRLRSTAALWDNEYVDESWIDQPVRLIPRMHQWIDTYYPGTKLAITEYNFGALDNINGALTQAEVLGIFGREGVDLATLWAPKDAGTPFTYAFQIYLNYDDRGGTFGDMSVHSTSANHEQLSVFAAQRAVDSTVTALVINKSDIDIDGAITVTNFQPRGIVQRYRYGDGNLTAIQPLPETQITDNVFVDRFPRNSFTLLVIPQ